MTDDISARLKQAIRDLVHQSANDTSVLVALADLSEADPGRVPELLAEVRLRAPRMTESLRVASALARSLPSA
jgi:hypothetical protein